MRILALALALLLAIALMTVIYMISESYYNASINYKTGPYRFDSRKSDGQRYYFDKGDR